MILEDDRRRSLINCVTIPDSLLELVEKPSRYTGNEWNMIMKNSDERSVKFAFCFPDVYEVGMSHLGMRILYDVVNSIEDVCCERVFAPWDDMEQLMRANSIPLYALESKEAIRTFDFLGFTLQYEMCYTNVLNMLDLAGVPIKSEERDDNDPIVCAGGPCVCNPEPMAEFIDFFMPGEGEEILVEVMELYKTFRAGGADAAGADADADARRNSRRKGFLLELSKIEGIYVPSLHKPSKPERSQLSPPDQPEQPEQTQIPIPDQPDQPEQPQQRIKKRIIKDFDSVLFPRKTLVPYTEIVHDRVMLETFRGCIRGCRFCQAGYIYRPVREKTPETLVRQACDLIDSTGYEEFSLTSLSTSDYTRLGLLTDSLIEKMNGKHVNFSLPSLRIDSFSLDLMEKSHSVRKSGLTFAPEAGTQRLRDVINKGVTEEDLLNSVSLAFNGGWNSVKLYFMIGLPTETMEDVEGIVDLAKKVVKEYFKVPKEKRAPNLHVNISVSSFVPKPFTPFQWEPQDQIEILAEKQRHIKDMLKQQKLRQVTYNWHDAQTSFLEAVFARGDRRVGDVIFEAWKMGCKFDGWGEFFRYDVWMEAFKKCGVIPTYYANRARHQDEVFPWDHMDYGISKKYLWKERRRAFDGKLTPNCRTACSGCGLTNSFECPESNSYYNENEGTV